MLTIILAGGSGERLQPLTKLRSKPSVPFAGKYRLIDFTLSNCINSGIRQILILVQYRSWSLQRHIQEGWGISGAGLGEYVYCVPAQQKLGADWYHGTADAVRQNLDLIQNKSYEHILILSGDHVCKMNYRQMLDFHIERKASLTVSAARVRKETAAGALGVFTVDDEFNAAGFLEKPADPPVIPSEPDRVLASMGVYVFKTDFLLKVLQGKGDDFGKHIIPEMVKRGENVLIYDFAEQNKIEDFEVRVENGKRKRMLVDRTRDSLYWRDVGTLDTYYQASMDLIGIDPLLNLYTERWMFRTFERSLPPSKCIIGGKALESMISDGCIISGGLVQRSVLSPGVIVERDSLVEDSVVFDDVVIEPGAQIRNAIIDKEVTIQAGALLGYDRDADLQRGCTISEGGVVVVPRGMDLGRAP